MKDLRVLKKPVRRTKKCLQDFLEFVFSYSYYSYSSDNSNEIVLCHKVLAEYFLVSSKSISRWIEKGIEIGAIYKAEREDAGVTRYYKKKDENGETFKVAYTVSQYKKVKVGKNDKDNFVTYVNVYKVDKNKLNEYFLNTININLFDLVKENKDLFNDYIKFLDSKNSVERLEQKEPSTLSKNQRKLLKNTKKLEDKQTDNEYYVKKNNELSERMPEFACKYLGEGSLRLTHSLCHTVNPEHKDKIDETKYWKTSTIRYNMLSDILGTSNVIERDVNGSIYRLTYNLYHKTPLDPNTDIYKLIWDSKFDIKWPDDTYRNAFKSMLMAIFMRDYLVKFKACRHNYILKYYADYEKKYNRLPKDDKDRFETYKKFTDLLNIDVETFLLNVREAMYKTLGTRKFARADIFIHESNLHILIREKFLDKGIKTANVYDGFYFEDGYVSEDDFYNVYHEAIADLKYNLANGIGTPLL